MRNSFFWALVVFVGCSKLESNSIRTSGISASIRVSSNGSGSGASASLMVGKSATTYVDLSPGDTLVATVDGQSKTMARSSLFNVVTYGATINNADKEGTVYVVALNRTGDTSAPSSTCTLPGPFTLQAPQSGASFSRSSDDIVVTYTGPSTDAMSWEASGSCIEGRNNNVTGDPGSITIPKGTFKGTASGATTTCTVTLALKRKRSGALDAAYGYGGSITCEQKRSLTFSSKP